APSQRARQQALKAEIAELEARLPGSPELQTRLQEKRQELNAIQPISLPVLKELPPDRQRPTHLLTLGNFLLKGERVEAGTPEYFPSLPGTSRPNRLDLARWLFLPQNPLTARVAVNRFWAQLFGRGLVETEEDFGMQGTPPTHPELLDWLAVYFRETGWDIKRLLRLIVTSSTYRQSSQVTPIHLKKDPRNLWLARYPRRRLDAETIRDQALAISGLLSRKIGGPSVYPPQPEGLWRAAFNGERTWPTSTGEDRYRRGIYTFWRRTVPHPAMTTFDAPSREICTFRRQPTNTPLQALVTLNDPAFIEIAQALARRIVREGGTTPEQRIRYALKLATARLPAPEQVATLLRLYTQERQHYAGRPQEALKLATDPLGPLPDTEKPEEMAAWTVVANVLLNMDAVLTHH
ncbi:MAG: DUF1553 domain-containing protein, partial [Chloroherpetonaceae bacterium]|nr:DUF1553 domain-containing protein [Chthonomonadaceae bacterium]MDW8208543.1 DUF1553 domain-containing protein [Chloroherpetonaceae bacterium]